MIDLHCHYLPGVDDGAPDTETALALVRAAADNGIREAVLTPHVFPGRWDNSTVNLGPVFEAFCAAVSEAGIPIRLYLGGEVRLLPETLEMVASGTAPFLGGWQGKRVMLMELPDGQIPVGTMQAVKFLMRANVVPLIAHPERNREVMRTPAKLEPFVKEGCLLQLTAASVTGDFGTQARDTATRILERGWAFAVATDSHNLAHRPPMLNEARLELARRYGEETATALTIGNPMAVVSTRSGPWEGGVR